MKVDIRIIRVATQKESVGVAVYAEKDSEVTIHNPFKIAFVRVFVGNINVISVLDLRSGGDRERYLAGCINERTALFRRHSRSVLCYLIEFCLVVLVVLDEVFDGDLVFLRAFDGFEFNLYRRSVVNLPGVERPGFVRFGASEKLVDTLPR